MDRRPILPVPSEVAVLGSRAIVVALLTALGLFVSVVVVASPALAAQPGPVVVAPSYGQALDHAGDVVVTVKPVSGASGYLFGFFQNGSGVWENYANERTLSGTEYAIRAGTAAHEAVKPGVVDIWVRALVDNQWTDATIIKVMLESPPTGGSPSPGAGQQPPWFCIIGPNGTGCDISNPAPVAKPTWNTYLKWLDEFADGVSGTATSVRCGGASNGSTVACLSILVEQFPLVAAAVDGLGCASGVRGVHALRDCLGVGAWGLRAVVGAVRATAAINPDVRRFLDGPMPI